jgi:hypothetical protein
MAVIFTNHDTMMMMTLGHRDGPSHDRRRGRDPYEDD